MKKHTIVLAAFLILLAVSFYVSPHKAFLLSGIVLNAGLAAMFCAGVHFKLHALFFITLGILPIALPLMVNQNFRVYGHHGWHQGMISYQILENSIPPGNPLLAGTYLLYAWGYPLLIAIVSRLLNVSPFCAAGLLSLLLLVCMLLVTFRIARLFTSDRNVAVFGVACSLYAFTFTQGGWRNPFQILLQRITAYSFLEARSTPIYSKFCGDTAFHFGIFFYAIWLYLLIKVVAEDQHSKWYWFGLLCAITSLGFFYPFMLPAVISGQVLAVCYSVFRTRRIRRAVLKGVVLGLALLILSPYILSLYTGKADEARLHIVFHYAHVLRNLRIGLVTFIPLCLICIFGWNTLLKMHKAFPARVEIMLILILNGAGLFLFTSAPITCEYKYMSIGVFGFGILGGTVLGHWWHNHRLAVFLSMSLFSLPVGLIFSGTLLGWREPIEPYRIEGRYLRHAREADDQLYLWIRDNTKKSDIFIDTQPSIPVFAQRALYIGYDESNVYDMYLDDILGAIEGHDASVLSHRMEVVLSLYKGESDASDVEFTARVREGIPADAAIYVVSRSPEVRDNFDRAGYLEEVFRKDDLGLYRMSR